MTNILLASSGFGVGEIVLIVACALFVVGVAVVGVIRKKKASRPATAETVCIAPPAVRKPM